MVGAVINEDLVARMEFAPKQGMIVESMRLLDGLRYKGRIFSIRADLRGRVGTVGLRIKRFGQGQWTARAETGASDRARLTHVDVKLRSTPFRASGPLNSTMSALSRRL